MSTVFGRDKTRPVEQANALPGRETRMPVPSAHAVFTDRPIAAPFPSQVEVAVFGMGCFWGAERLFWQTEGVWTTAVGYAGGYTANPTYEEVCSGLTGHAEVVLVAFDPSVVTYDALLKLFWEEHDPTQGNRQGNDVGTQYRSTLYYTSDEQKKTIEESRTAYQAALTRGGHGQITTEVAPLGEFYYAEDYHQQYLSDAKNPNGYCGLAGTGVSCPIGLNVERA
ncbi:peptide-methionine (S)-S-oxide reductase MsrA [Actinophytocola sp.]|uniref:peptide-methionine (S)-S-oxide reductase MsrA n=1 Tax=Actinophytocola sp. TaxID=1872138 RepID=UPI002ED18FF1